VQKIDDPANAAGAAVKGIMGGQLSEAASQVLDVAQQTIDAIDTSASVGNTGNADLDRALDLAARTFAGRLRNLRTELETRLKECNNICICN